MFMFHCICCTRLRNHLLLWMGNFYSQIDVKTNQEFLQGCTSFQELQKRTKPWPETLVILIACLLKHTQPNTWKIQRMKFGMRFHSLFWLYHFKILQLHNCEQYSVTIDLTNGSCFPPHVHYIHHHRHHL